MVVIFIRLAYHDATLVRLELEVTDTILLDVLHHTEGHGDRYIGSLFRGDEPVPDDSYSQVEHSKTHLCLNPRLFSKGE